MKKTIAVTIILTSASLVNGMMEPTLPAPPPKRICLQSSTSHDKSQVLGNCDESENNRKLKRKLQDNGCAVGQAALTVTKPVSIPACLPPGVVQL